MLQFDHAPVFAPGPVLAVFEQRPTQFFEVRHQSRLSQGPGFLSANLVQGLVELSANVETIQNVQRLQAGFDGRR